jgi:hypothetical protein
VTDIDETSFLDFEPGKNEAEEAEEMLSHF